MASLQREADDRLAFLERTTGEAEKRLELLEQTSAAYRDARAQIAAMEELALSNREQLAMMREQNEMLAQAAADRLAALETNVSAVARLRDELAAREAVIEQLQALVAASTPPASGPRTQVGELAQELDLPLE